MQPIKKSSIRIFENERKVRELKIFLKFVKKNSVKLEDIEEYTYYLKNRLNAKGTPLSISTIQNHIYKISSKLQKTLVASGRMRDIGELLYFIKSLPIGKYETNPNFFVPSKSDMKRLIKFSPSDLSLIIKTYYLTGARYQELLDIKISEIVVSKKEAQINIFGKGSKPRIVTIPAKLLREIKKEFKPKIFIFENSFGRKYKQRNLSKKLEKISKKILGKKITFHMLRKAFVTHVYKAHPHIKAVASYVGNTPAILAKHYLKDILKSNKIYKTLLTKEDKEKYL